MRLAMSSLVSSATSTRSAFLLRRFMATLQCRTLNSSFGFGNKYNKCCLLKCLNSWQSFHLFRSLPGACCFNSRYISSCLPLDRGIRLASPNSILFPKRYFFHVSKAANEEKRGNSFPFKFKKNWIQTKALASARKNKDVSMVTSASEQLVEEAKEGGTQKSKVNNKTKQPSRSKKSKEQLSAATASEQATVEKSPTQASKKTSTGITPMETLNSSVSTKQQSNKKSENSSRKGKSLKVASQKQKPEKVIIKKHQGQKNLKPLYPPTGKSVVVVESVTKAKVIQGYLGDMYEVLPSYGHIRDLAARSGSVRPDDDFSMVWEVSLAAWTHLQSIRMALNGAESIILASDPDHEGEAIGWHITEMLQQQDALSENITVARVVFHEITEASIKSALQAPREVDVNLVHSYLARRALDYLIGFNISPLLWRKLPGCQSAGRVQSAALSLICDRELEIDEFKPQEYWSIEVELNKQEPNSSADSFCFPAHLTHFKSKKLNQYSISSHTKAKDIEQKINTIDLQVIGSKKSTMRENPPTPYITSTLQQDAANILHFSVSYTMKLAQKLYEGVQLSEGKAAGLITYMRTDGLRISDEVVRDIRSLLIERYGSDYASESPQKYFKKVKNAQVAHEAIRPTDMRRLPAMLTGILDEDSLKLYTLIWSRTMACQMKPAIIRQIQLDIGDTTESIVFCSSCSKVEFRGFQAVYEDANAGAVKYKENEEKDCDEAFEILHSLKSGEPLSLCQVELKQHHSQPPPRYSEGSLVKKLEELGIGRPSTYASTLKVLWDRKYVTVKSRVLYPEFRGRMVSAFLSHHFSEVTNYSFTADIETELDNVSAGLSEWKGLLRDYWTRFSSYCTRAQSVHIHQVEEMLGKTFGDFLFASLPSKDRACPSCSDGTLIFKVSRFGAGYFIGCNQHPKCKYIAKTLYSDDVEEEDSPEKSSTVEEPRLMGLHPGSHEKVLLKSGPYGFYVQLGEDRMDYTPKRVNASHIKDMDSITLEDALELLRFPLTLGNHPKDGHPVILRHGNTGFTVRHRGALVHVPKNMNPKDVTLEKALKFLSGKNVKLMGRRKRKVEEPVEAM